MIITKNILLIINDYHLNSINKINLSIIRGTKEYHFFILAINDFGICLEDFKKNDNVTLIAQQRKPIQKLKQAQKIIKNNKIKVIHTHNLKSEFFALFLKIMNPTLFVISNRHNHLFPIYSFKDLLKNYCYVINCHLTNLNVCVAKHLSKKIENKIKVKKSKIITIQNGLSSYQTCKKTKRPKELPKIIYFGQLIKRKNLKTLIKASGLLEKKVKILIIGQGKAKNELQTLAKNKKNINFKSFTKHPEQYFKTGDIFVLPSRSEGLSLSLLESIKHGLVPIVSNIEANREVIKNKKNGLLFQENNARDLAVKINLILNNKELAQKMSRQAKLDLEKHFSTKKMLDSYFKLYAQTIN